MESTNGEVAVPPNAVYSRKRSNSAPNASTSEFNTTETKCFSQDDTEGEIKLKRKANLNDEDKFDLGYESNKRRDRPSGLDEDKQVDEIHEMDRSHEVDESFFDLLNTFASLDLPTEPEKCPMCPKTFPIEEFATHVYECIKQLDHIEEKIQLERDEALAVRLSLQTNGPELDVDNVLAQFSTLPRGSMCPQGLNCRRYDVSHHNWFTHPEAACPICNESWPVHDIDAHVVLCLNKQDNPSNSFASSSMSTSSSSGLGAGFGAPRELNDNSDNEDSQDVPGLNGNQDDDGDDEECGLSMGQLGAMSRIVLEQRNKGASQQDVSLVQLLDTFKTLGFTRENLTRATQKMGNTDNPTSTTSTQDDQKQA